jgi:hypothetical protein
MQSRREFLIHLVSATVTAGTIIACGGGGPGPEPDPDPDPDPDPPDQDPQDPLTPDAGQPPSELCANGTRVTIGSNHGHQLTVSAADVQAAVERTYDITGTSSHSHSVTVTAAMFEMLARNMTVTVESTTDDSHSHTVLITCN